MEPYKVLTFPDPFLKTIAKPVAVFDEELKEIADRMIVTMYESGGIGLAAIQVGIDKRMFVMDVSYSKEMPESDRNPTVIINPEIEEKGQAALGEEGCLSVPEFRADVKRASEIVLRFKDLNGEQQELEADGMMAVCIQHETDHLNGKLFIDYLPPLQRNMIRKKLKKMAG